MPSSEAVLNELSNIIESVTGTPATSVIPSALLADDLEIDSLSIVEISEALGAHFDVYIPDSTIDSMVTVSDAIDAIVKPGPQSTPPGGGLQSRTLTAEESSRRNRAALHFAKWFVLVGLALGLVLGLGGLALIRATGIDDVKALPQVSSSTTTAPKTTATTKETPSPTPSPTPSAPETSEPAEPELNAGSTSIAPGEKLTLVGKVPELGKGAPLQVQVKDKGEDWDDFPVDTKTRDDDGSFRTMIYTTRTGERQFRLKSKDSDVATPPVTITIG